MSSVPIQVPARRDATVGRAESSYSSSGSSSWSSPLRRESLSVTPLSEKKKGKARATDGDVERVAPRRPSLLGSSLSKSEYTVINLADEDGPPRLVTCVKSSQGFDWNQELFLPSYADYDAQNLEHKQDVVEEIILTDEEAAAMLPQ